MARVVFSASGYGTKEYKYATLAAAKRAAKKDAEITVADFNGEVQDYGDELVGVDHDGQEIARWEIFG